MADPERKWFLNTGGRYYPDGRNPIEPGQKFQAFESEIPKGFRDTIIPTDPPQRRRRRRSSGSAEQGSDEGESGAEGEESAFQLPQNS